MPAPPRVAERCARHPARLAVDACPRCGRGRCSADVSTFGARGCELCPAELTASAAPAGELLLRAALGAFGATLVGGWVLTQYVNVHLMSLIAPAILGLAAAWAVSTAAGRRAGIGRVPVVVFAALSAVLGTALGVRFFGRPLTPVSPWHQVGPPYVTAILGALAWPALFGPVRRREPDR